MAKFFNKEYKHAYKRGNKVWVQGRLAGSEYFRLSTNKEFNRANMNWVEKHWGELIQEHINQIEDKFRRDAIPTVSEFIPISLELNEDSADKHTIKSYEGILNRHIVPEFGNHKIDSITATDIKLWQKKLYSEKLLSQKSIINIRAIFSGVFRNAIECGYTAVNPISITKAPSKKNFLKFTDDGEVTNLKGEEITESIDPFSLEDVFLLLDKASGQFKNILATLFFSGMRTGEMVALKWDDVDWRGKTIHIQRARKRDGSLGLTKNGKTRRIDMLPPVEDALINQYKITGMQHGFVFLNQYGKHYEDYGVLRNYHWKTLLKRLGFEYRKFYQTRHTFASIMLQKGEDITWVSQRMMGHSDIATTLKFYSKYISSEKKEHATFLNNSRTILVQSDSLIA